MRGQENTHGLVGPTPQQLAQMQRVRGKRALPQELMIYPVPAMPSHPHWFETYMVSDQRTLEFLGFVGKLGASETYEWWDGLPGDKGRGRCQGRDCAAMKLWERTCK